MIGKAGSGKRTVISQAEAAAYSPYLYIWGTEWTANAFLQILWKWDPDGTIRAILLWAAAGLSALFLLLGSRNKTERRGERRLGGMIPLLVAAVLLLVVLLISQIVSTGLFFPVVLRTIALALFYLFLGAVLGRELLYLGIWLLALSGIIAYWFLGYAPIVLGLFGGLSLIACALILRLWGLSRLGRQHQ